MQNESIPHDIRAALEKRLAEHPAEDSPVSEEKDEAMDELRAFASAIELDRPEEAQASLADDSNESSLPTLMGNNEREESSTEDACRKSGTWITLHPMAGFLILAFVFLYIQTLCGIADAFSESHIRGAVYAAIAAAATLCLLAAVIREVRALKSLRRFAQRRSDGNRNDTTAFLNALQVANTRDAMAGVEAWRNQLSSNATPESVRESYAELVLVPHVDPQVRKAISSRAMQTAAIIVFSPFAVTDMMFMLANGLFLINDIAGKYGVRLTPFARVCLYGSMLKHLAIVGAVQGLDDVVSSFMSSVVGKVSAKVGQGAIAAILITRLGIQVARQCRPVPLQIEGSAFASLTADIAKDFGKTILSKFASSMVKRKIQ